MRTAAPGSRRRRRPVAGRPFAALRLGVALGLTLLLGAGAWGCGGGDSAPPDHLDAGPTLGVKPELADCEDWRNGTANERLGTVEQIRAFAGGPVGEPRGYGATLDDKDAYHLFESWCANDFASAFKLYKLYTRAAAFGAN